MLGASESPPPNLAGPDSRGDGQDETKMPQGQTGLFPIVVLFDLP